MSYEVHAEKHQTVDKISNFKVLKMTSGQSKANRKKIPALMTSCALYGCKILSCECTANVKGCNKRN